MIRGIGVDVVEIERIQQAIDRFGDRFLRKVYTPFEIAACGKRSKLRFPELAARYAAKEAYTKAIGTGLRGIALRNIEVRNDPRGKPYIVVPKKYPQKTEVTLTHGRETAIAVVIVQD